MVDGVIPFTRPLLAARSTEYLADVLATGQLAGDGAYARRCESAISEILGARRAFLTTSCTDALEMAALLLDLEPGDEVIVPSFTFTSTATAFALRGARLVFADCRADTLNIDERQLDSLVTDRTRAVVVMHYGGVACEMDAVSAVAEKHGLDVVEDNAHGLGAAYRGRKLGTIGRFGAQSFHATKNVSSGEGGALVVNRAADVERAEVAREKGTNRSKFRRGEIDRYTWVADGSSYLPSELTAALLLSQLEEFPAIQERRRKIVERYAADLADAARAAGARLPVVPDGAEQAYHVFWLLLADPAARERLQAGLRSDGIVAATHYVPLHSSPAGRRAGRGECPVAEDVSERLLRLPLYTDMADVEVDRVIASVLSHLG